MKQLKCTLKVNLLIETSFIENKEHSLFIINLLSLIKLKKIILKVKRKKNLDINKLFFNF